MIRFIFSFIFLIVAIGVIIDCCSNKPKIQSPVYFEDNITIQKFMYDLGKGIKKAKDSFKKGYNSK